MTKTEAIEKIKNQVEHYLNRAEGLYDFRPSVSILFDLKGRAAGQYWKRKGVCYLRFNLNALEVEGGWTHLYNNTVPHEVAHLIQRNHPTWPTDRTANKSHGVYWQRVMADFGVEANRCHSLDLPKSRIQRKYLYKCGCKQWELSVTRHNRSEKARKLNQKPFYSCRSCDKPLFVVVY